MIKGEEDNTSTLRKEAYINEKTLFKRLLKGHVDVVIMERLSGDYYVNTYFKDADIVSAPYEEVIRRENVSNMAFSKMCTQRNLVKIFEEGYKELEEDGTLAKIEHRYL